MDNAADFVVEKYAGTYYVFLYGSFVDCSQLVDVVIALKEATPVEQVNIYINTPGGNLDVADAIVHAMKCCKAEIKVVATGSVNSAGTFILMNTDNLELSNYFSSLIHCPLISLNEDHLPNTTMNMNFIGSQIRNIIKDIYKDFLTDEEIERVLNNEQFIFGKQEFLDRHKHMVSCKKTRLSLKH